MLASMFGIVMASWAFSGSIQDVNIHISPDRGDWSTQADKTEDSQRLVTLNYFTEVTGNREMTMVVMDAADRYQIPYSLAFALAYKESSFDFLQVSANANSVDRGLFQLNSLSFPDLAESEFFDIKTNADRGMAYLRYCWNRGGNATVALAMYNAGPTRVETQGTPSFTMNYIHKIYQFQDYYDREIEKRLILNTQALRDSVKTAKNISSLIEQRADIN